MKTSPPSLLQQANLMAGAQNYPLGCLYIVPTPIGNLADMTLRALHVLSIVDAIACEDTRNSKTLLNHYGLSHQILFSLHQHNEHAATASLIQRLQNNQRIALITDAGTPAISDPGARAVAAIREAGFRVIPLPGASSITTALSAAGIVQGNALFHGFLPTKQQERKQTLQTLLDTPYALILLEAPHRINALISDLSTITPDRTITLARELTKQFEQIVTYNATTLYHWLNEKTDHQKGEFVCIVHPPTTTANTENHIYDDFLRQALIHMPTKAAAQLISNITGVSKNILYQRALTLKEQNNNCSKKSSQML